jgi:small-conductance mechanosensitive channel
MSMCRLLLRSVLVFLVIVTAVIPLPSQTPNPATNLPGAKDTLQYLKDTINWYHGLRLEEQVATAPSDLMFLDDDRQLAKQIVRLSFDFARAEAKLLSTETTSAAAAANQSPELARYSGLIQAAEAADKEVRETEEELGSVKQKLQTAQGAQRRELQSTIDELQSELNLDRTRSETFRSILQFVGEAGAAGTNLQTQIDELQRSLPDVADAGKSSGAQVSDSVAANTAIVQAANRNQRPSGILDLVTSLFALNGKVRSLDETIQSTDALSNSSQQIRTPLLRNLTTAAQRGEQLAKEADTSGPAQLQQQKRELDTLTGHFKELSSVMVPLERQSILLGLYKCAVNRWKTAVESQYSVELRGLIVRAVVLGFALAVVFILAEIWRKATLRYVRDIRRRYQFLLLRRIVLWCAVGITVAFALATEIGSLATFAGLMTAGLAVALQNVILAIAGYFFLVGKYGVRVGDRVQISGVTGNVVDIGLIRLHLMELAGPGSDRQPTGRVVVFSNSIVFQPSAGFFKQIPGTNFGWHEVTLILSPDSDYYVAEQRMLSAVEGVYAKYRNKIEEQHRRMEQTFALGLDLPQPKSRLRLTQTGLEVVIRYPLELERSAEIDDQIIRELLAALEKPPKLKLVGSGTPNIQPILDGHTAA